MATLLLPVVLFARAPCPKAMLLVPVVLKRRALSPTAVLKLAGIESQCLKTHGRVLIASGVVLERPSAEVSS